MFISFKDSCNGIYDKTENFYRYLSEIRHIDNLSDAEFKQLFNNYKNNGDIKAFNRIIEANLLYAVKFASRYVGSGTPYSDLISACNEALIRALQKYDINTGGNFRSYANYHLMSKLRFETARDMQVKPSTEALKRMKSGEPMSDVISFQSINDTDNDDKVPYQPESTDKTLDPEYIFHGEDSKWILDLVKTLREREQKIIILKHGLYGNKEHTFAEIGNIIGVSHQAIHDTYKKALNKLKNKIKDEKFSKLQRG